MAQSPSEVSDESGGRATAAPSATAPPLARHFTTQLATRGEKGTATAGEMDNFADALLRDALEARASDLHLEPLNGTLRIRFRIDGELLDAARVPGAQGKRLLNHFKAIGDIDPGHLFYPQERRLDYQLDGQELNLRLAVTPCLESEMMVIRMLLPEMLEQRLSALGMHEQDLQRVYDWLASTSGMLLATGPTGSGKTTTIYSLLRELSDRARSICTIEDPVEYELPGINQIPVDEEHQLTYANGIRSVLRMDPDFIMLGEMRDAPSAEAGLTAANRGTVVLSTMHSRDPFSVVTTFRNWHLPDNEIAVGMNMLITQRLVRRLCPECRHQAKPSDEQKRWLRGAGAKVPSKVWQAGACHACRGLGYHGRTGIFEIWQLDEADYSAILAGIDEHGLRRQVAEKGHRTMVQDGLSKAHEGVTSIDALRNVPDLLPLRALSEHNHKHGTASTAKRKRTTKTTNKPNNGSTNSRGKSKSKSKSTSRSAN